MPAPTFRFLYREAEGVIGPSLWRQAQILTKHGLFKVAERIWQVRGFDVSTVSFIDAGEGSPDGFRVDIHGNLWCGWGSMTDPALACQARTSIAFIPFLTLGPRPNTRGRADLRPDSG